MLRRLAITVLVPGILVAGATAAVAATPSRAQIDVVKVSGLIDPIDADLVSHALADANRSHALVLVVQLNATGGVVDARRVAALVGQIRTSPVPVAVWVGGSNRPRAYGPAFTLLSAADFTGVGPGARLGNAPPLTGRTLSADEAIANHVVEVAAPTLGDFIVDLDGRTLDHHQPVHLARVVSVAGVPRRELRADVGVTFSQLTVWPRLLHTVASPNVAYSMLLIALSLAVFEFFTAGIGVAAATAAGFGALSAYGLGVLPTRPWAVGLLALAIVGYAIDVQAGAPRAWTVIGTLALAAGSVWLYHSQSVSPWVLAIMAVLIVLFMVAGMPAMVRTRFSTPTIGRQSLVGTLGSALSAVDPDGTVEVSGAPWRARTNRATPIPPGDRVRVTGIDGLVLEVEPEHGGAREPHH